MDTRGKKMEGTVKCHLAKNSAGRNVTPERKLEQPPENSKK
jgi:hypothetical protein